MTSIGARRTKYPTCRAILCVALTAGLGFACGDDDANLDAGPGFDTGPGFDGGPDFDGGPAFDGGPNVDGGTPFDGGPNFDAGPLPEGIPVPLSSVVDEANRDTLVITFDRRVSVDGPEGFTIRGGDALTVTSASANGNDLVLGLSGEAKYLQNALTWSYAESEGSVHNLRDLLLIYIDNRILEPAMSGTEYFVAVDGTETNTGLSEASPWSIEHAVTQVAPGDKVWIRAGVYDDKHITFTIDGTEDARITFEGYRTSVAGVPDPITEISFMPPDVMTISGDELPLFDGVNREGIGFRITGRSFLTFRNLAFSEYNAAIHANSSPFRLEYEDTGSIHYCLFDGIHGTTMGVGDGILILIGLPLYNDYNTIQNSRSLDSATTAFHLSGRGSAILDSFSFGSRDDVGGVRESQDYYFSLKGAENVMLRNVAHKLNVYRHPGHGFALRGEEPHRTEWNLVQDNVVTNIVGAYELRNETSAYNVIRDCIANADGAVGATSSGAIQFSNGAHHNIIEGFSGRGVDSAFRFLESGESPVLSCGHDNLVRNSEFYGMEGLGDEGQGTLRYIFHGWTFNSDSANPAFENNRFVGCTFNGYTQFFRMTAETGVDGVTASGNELIGCSISGGSTFKRRSTLAHTGFAFSASNFFEAAVDDDGFAEIRAADGNMSMDPGYVDAAGYDFHLAADSPIAEVFRTG